MLALATLAALALLVASPSGSLALATDGSSARGEGSASDEPHVEPSE